MQIGSSFNFPQLPSRGRASVARPAPVTPESTEPSPPGARQPRRADAAERFQQPRQEQATYYSTDRDLSLKGLRALQAYQTTSGFAFAGGGELVGVDLYI